MEKQFQFDLERYISREQFNRIKKFSEDKETPFLVIDLKKVEQKYDELLDTLPFAKIYYAVKANPHESVIRMLVKKGSSFDIASVYELDHILALGAAPEKISYGNTIKKANDIAYAYSKGVRLFATDSENDLIKIAKNAPGSRVFFRILTDGSGADWPLSRKFGAHPDTIYKLILQASEMGLVPYGISFHVGSQQRDIGQWDNAIATCRYLFDATKAEGVELKMINLGGGFPATYISPTKETSVYGSEIIRFLKEDFGENLPEVLLEPGRFMAGDAGILITEVVLISRKSEANQYSWVYLDAGKFGGLIETLDESIKYPIYSEKTGPVQETILAGPTCDSMDILYENEKYELPASLTEGDRLYFFTTGAYTQSYSSVNFNGFPPLRAYVLED
ncbi:MAG: type III PLP-dependent enzyme [Synergistaceae bacterium]|nr:type III PLP-dependent enzyme [Synergistaceae bacterium]MDD3689094.1 type III PLP-dependent enzyme [Synergistaceae bacterium]MDD4020286.1 type III PLP-dependent enzyme [Synergistaceae bacterium]MDD4612655.1 type III PLP-dependent enzyme [Synergistaceae bacterium]